MPQPIRSIRLEKRSTRSLNVLSGSVGEIFYDSENSALRLFTASAGTNVTLADRDWVTANFANASNSFSGAYSDLTGTPAAITNLSAFTNDAGFITADDVDVDISSINSIGDVDTATNAPTTGQLLQWDGVKWANATVAGLADTNTTYALSGEASGIGVDLKLTDVGGTQFAVNIRGGAGITPSITSTNEITISNSSALTNLTDATVINPAEGQILKYTSGTWINVTPAVVDGVALNDLSVTNDATGAGAGALAYDSGTGEFTFTPADLSGAISLTSLSLSQTAASGGGTLAYNNTSGVFTFSPANLSTYAQTSSLPTSITELGVTDGTNGQVLTTDGSGNFTFSSAGGGASYDQDLNTTDSVVFAAVSADTFSNASAGAPTVTSATTITLDAPDGVIITGGTFRLPSFTTTQKNALTAANGDIIYDSTTSQAQVYEGSWTSISGGGGITLADARNGLSVTQASASGTGALSYANASGAFTYTPPDTSSFLTSVAFADLTTTPTTLSGYGITDAASTAQGVLADSALQSVAFTDLTATPTTLSAYGITDAATTAQGALADSALQNGGSFDGDVVGSVFGDDSTVIVDGVNNRLVVGGITIGPFTAPVASDPGSYYITPAKMAQVDGSLHVLGVPRVGDDESGGYYSVFEKGIRVIGEMRNVGLHRETLSSNYMPSSNFPTGVTDLRMNYEYDADGAPSAALLGSGHWYMYQPATDCTTNLTGLSEYNDYTTVVTIGIYQASTPVLPPLQIDGVAITIAWQYGVVPTVSPAQYNVIQYQCMRLANSWYVLGHMGVYA